MSLNHFHARRMILKCGLALMVGSSSIGLVHAQGELEFLPYTHVPLIGGGSFRLDAPGQLTLVNFWAPWCANCLEEIAALNEVAREHAAKHNVRVVGIALDAGTPEKIESFAQEHEIRYPIGYLRTANLPAALDLPALPMTWIVSSDGRVLSRLLGSQSASVFAQTLSESVGLTRSAR